MDINEVIHVIVRLSPSGDELDVELPLYSTGKEIIDSLIENNIVPQHDQEGNPHVYKLMSKDRGSEIAPEKTLYDLSVKQGETLLLMPKLVAGSSSCSG